MDLSLPITVDFSRPITADLSQPIMVDLSRPITVNFGRGHLAGDDLIADGEEPFAGRVRPVILVTLVPLKQIPVYCRFRAKREQIKTFSGLLP